jgi:hypothetical protein
MRKSIITMSLLRFAAGDKKGIRVEYIRLFKPEVTEFKRRVADIRTNGPSD